MLYKCLITILQYLIDSSNTPDLNVLSSYLVIVEIILYYRPNDTVAHNAKHCLKKKLNNTLEEMNREDNHCHD